MHLLGKNYWGPASALIPVFDRHYMLNCRTPISAVGADYVAHGFAYAKCFEAITSNIEASGHARFA